MCPNQCLLTFIVHYRFKYCIDEPAILKENGFLRDGSPVAIGQVHLYYILHLLCLVIKVVILKILDMATRFRTKVGCL